MKNQFLNKGLQVILILILTGCAQTSPVAITPVATELSVISTVIPTILPTATTSPEPTAAQTSFTSSIYKDEANGFELKYPAGWTLIPNRQIGSRGAQAQLFSPGTTAEMLAAGGTRLSITIYDWDPKNDLAAYVIQRKIAWDASGFTLIKEDKGDLADGRKEMHYIVENPEKQPAFFLFTTVGEKYLQIAGEGDLDLIKEIAHTLRF